jgi:glutathione synthase/RimK-type ligase-like ATP-grasp enzyme
MPYMEAPVVLIGPEQDEHILTVQAGLREAGREPLILDPNRFPRSLAISMGNNSSDIRVDGYDLGRPAAVYLRSLQQTPIAFGSDSQAAMGTDWRQTLTTYHERNTMLTAMVMRWEELGVPLYNPFTAQRNITKPLQLALLAGAGLPVPRTLWSNKPEDVIAFAHSGPTIYKPVSGGAQTRELTAHDLTPERLAQLAIAPVTFQELLSGDDIRVFILDGKVIARYRIVTDALDFRHNEIAVENIQLPATIESQCLQACKLLDLRFTGMDLKYDADGQAKILELNSSPMFLGFDAMAGTDIRAALVEALLLHQGTATEEVSPS